MSKELVKKEEQNIYIEKGEKSLDYAEKITVTKKNAVIVKSVLQKMKNIRIEIEKKRVGWKEPYLKKGKDIDKIAKKLTLLIVKAEELTNDKLVKFGKEQREEIDEVNEKARKKHEEEQKALEEEKEKMEKSGSSKEEIEKFEDDKKEEIEEKVNEISEVKTVDIGGKKTIAWDIPVDDKVERSLCSSDSVKINDYKNRNKETIEKYLNKEDEFTVAGVRYFYNIKH